MTGMFNIVITKNTDWFKRRRRGSVGQQRLPCLFRHQLASFLNQIYCIPMSWRFASKSKPTRLAGLQVPAPNNLMRSISIALNIITLNSISSWAKSIVPSLQATLRNLTRSERSILAWGPFWTLSVTFRTLQLLRGSNDVAMSIWIWQHPRFKISKTVQLNYVWPLRAQSQNEAQSAQGFAGVFNFPILRCWIPIHALFSQLTIP